MIFLMPSKDGSLDGLTKRGGYALHRQYPDEIVEEFKFSDCHFFIDENTHSIAQEHGAVVKRLTFLGHAHAKTYSEYSPKQFVDALVKEIEFASTFDATIKTSIQTIDLIGCETGLEDKEGESFAKSVATELCIQGFNIKVNSFTNRSATHPHLTAHTAVYHPKNTDIFQSLVMTSRDQLLKIQEITKDQSSLFGLKHNPKFKKFYEALSRLQDRWQTQKTEALMCSVDLALLGYEMTKNTAFTGEYESAKNHIEQFQAILKMLKHDDFLVDVEPFISPSELVATTLLHLDAYHVSLNMQINACDTQIKANCEIVATTPDPRAHFDTNLFCTFHPDLEKAEQQYGKYKKQKKDLQDFIKAFADIFTAYDGNKKEDAKQKLHQLFDYLIQKTKHELPTRLSKKAKLFLELLGKNGVNVSGIDNNNPENFRILPQRMEEQISVLDEKMKTLKKAAHIEMQRLEATKKKETFTTLFTNIKKHIHLYASQSTLLTTYLQAEKRQNISDLEEKLDIIKKDFQQNPDLDQAIKKTQEIVFEMKKMAPSKGFLDCLDAIHKTAEAIITPPTLHQRPAL